MPIRDGAIYLCMIRACNDPARLMAMADELARNHPRALGTEVLTRMVTLKLAHLLGDAELRSDKHDVVRHAILRRLMLIAWYDGHRREVLPHALGRQGSIDRVLCFQVGGGSSKGPIVSHSPNNWRCFDLSRLVIVDVRECEWVDCGYDGRQTCIDNLDLEICVPTRSQAK